MKRDRCVMIFLLVQFTAAGCGDRPSPAVSGVRDSAGVEIIELSMTDAPRWAVGAEPLLDLSARGDRGGEFYRVTDGALLADGSIAVLNAGSYQIRVFGANGELQHEFGREGDGPGEFRGPWRIYEMSNWEILVHDIRRATISVFDAGGDLLATTQLPPFAVWSLVDGWLDADRVLVSYWTVRPAPDAFQQQITQYLSYSWTTGQIDSLARVPSGMIGFIGGFAPWAIVGGALFDPAAHGVTVDELAVIGNGAIPELRFFDGAGTLRRVLRWQADPRPVTDEDVAAVRDARLAEVTDAHRRDSRRKQFEATPVADRFPAFGDLHADREGRVWIQEFVGPGDQRQVWWVVDADRRVVVQVTMPLGMQLLDARSDAVLVLERDDLDVEHVRLYPLESMLLDERTGKDVEAARGVVIEWLAAVRGSSTARRR